MGVGFGFIHHGGDVPSAVVEDQVVSAWMIVEESSDLSSPKESDGRSEETRAEQNNSQLFIWTCTSPASAGSRAELLPTYIVNLVIKYDPAIGCFRVVAHVLEREDALPLLCRSGRDFQRACSG